MLHNPSHPEDRPSGAAPPNGPWWRRFLRDLAVEIIGGLVVAGFIAVILLLL